MLRTIPGLLLFAALLLGCSPSTPTPLATPALPESVETWTIKMNQSGGIMGLSRSIEISSDGKFAAIDQRTEKTVDGQLSVQDLTKLRELVTAAESTPVPRPEQTGCADCFIYDLEIQGTDKPFTVQLNDITLPASGLDTLVMFLSDLMDKSLA